MKYYYEGYEILAPLTIVSNEPMFDSDTISLKKQRSSQGVQRWELSFNALTNSPADAMVAMTSFGTVKTMTMPQLTDVNKRIATTITHTVTVVNGIYHINGVQNPTLNFIAGNTYIFDQSDSSNASHPLRLSVNANGSPTYSTGVTITGTQGQSGAKTTIVVSTNTPSTLYYYCTNHANMGNSIITTAGSATTASYPKGSFITGTRTVNSVTTNKVYMVKSDASSIVDSNLYPTPPSGTTYSTVENATIKYYRDISDIKGITFTDGILSNPGTINIIEAL